MKSIFVNLVLLLFFGGALFAQEPMPDEILASANERLRPKKLYKKLGYKKYTNHYQRLRASRKEDLLIIKRLAKSYRLTGDYQSAAYWYGKYINQSNDAEDFFQYAQTLQSIGNCEDAVRWYKKHEQQTGNVNTLLADCTELEALTDRNDIEIKSLTAINSQHIDMAPVIYDDGIVFTSTRGFNRLKKTNDLWTGDNFADLFYAEKSFSGSYKNVKALKGEVNSSFHDGTATFDASGSVMIFTRSEKKGASENGVKHLKLYEAKNENGYWKNIRQLSISSPEYSTAHPSLSANGRQLFFVSDQPGGFGGMDIYVSVLLGGKWSKPENLGPIINTSGNEVFPFISKTGTLYFSSNGHKGFGGLDIYAANRLNPKDAKSWTVRNNMGKPINSIKDDFSFSVATDGESGYLASNRGYEKKDDDIYSWARIEVEEMEDPKTLKDIYVYDAASNERIEAALVMVEELASFKTDSDPLTKLMTDSEGNIHMSIGANRNYNFVVEKEGFQTKTIVVPGLKLASAESYGIAMDKRFFRPLDGLVLDETTKEIIPNATLEIINNCTGESRKLITDAAGRFKLSMECGCMLALNARKNGYLPEEAIINRTAQECKMMGIKEPEILEMAMSRIPEEEAKLKKHFLGDESKAFEKGQVFVIKNLYYNFDKANIRPDAAMQLDYVVDLLRYYPEMELKLEAHTDCRGKTKYNQRLSQRRAQSAVQYIIKKGIAKNRIIARGFGESQLVNHCADGINCSEAEHQENRRTEIRVLKFDDPNVRIEYRN